MKKMIAVLALLFPITAWPIDVFMPYQQWKEYMADQESRFFYGYAVGYAMSAIISVQVNANENNRYCAPGNLPINVPMLETTAEDFFEAHPEIDKAVLPMSVWLPDWFEWMFPCD